MDTPAGGSAWTAGQVARSLGISESTLRTWHRRYGLSPHGAQPGRYRRYDAEDVSRLRRMLDLVNLGMLASDAARAVQGGDGPSVAPARDVADLLAAARALDTPWCGALLDSLFARRGVVDAWELVCVPALLASDAHLRGDPALIAAEHCLSWALLGALHRLPRPPADPGAPFILLACTESEQHTLPLAALAAELTGHRVAARMLGAATPARTLERVVLESRPDAIVLWAQRAETADYAVLRTLSRHPVRLIAAGPGWDSRRLAGVEQITGLQAGVAALAANPGDLPAGPVAAAAEVHGSHETPGDRFRRAPASYRGNFPHHGDLTVPRDGTLPRSFQRARRPARLRGLGEGGPVPGQRHPEHVLSSFPELFPPEPPVRPPRRPWVRPEQVIPGSVAADPDPEPAGGWTSGTLTASSPAQPGPGPQDPHGA